MEQPTRNVANPQQLQCRIPVHTQGPVQQQSPAPARTHSLGGSSSPHQQLLMHYQHVQHQRSGLSTSSLTVMLLYLLLVSAGISHYVGNRSNSQGNIESGRSHPSRNLAAGIPTDSVPSAFTAAGDVTSGQGGSSDAPGNSSRSWHSKCAYGSMPGTWVDSAEPGHRWQLLVTYCQLKNWLAEYKAVIHSSSSSSSDDSSSSSSSSTPAAAVGEDASAHDPAVQAAAAAASSESFWSKMTFGHASKITRPFNSSSKSTSASNITDMGSEQQLPQVRILLLSDSVDRYIVQHACNYLGGAKETITMSHLPHQTPVVPAQDVSGDAQQHATDAAFAAVGTSSSSSSSSSGASSLNKTAYAFHVCQAGRLLKLASSYFPGVHPNGPFHRDLSQNYRQRIDAAKEMWDNYAGQGNSPQLVSVAALLWDVARLYMHEPQHSNQREELDFDLLKGWISNFTQVVQYAQQAFPEAKVWVTHSTMMPQFNAASGLMSKPYLGRRYFIHQLNAAAAAAAQELQLQLVDYAALSERFMTGQTYLEDLIHPNALVGVEVFNILLNLVLQEH